MRRVDKCGGGQVFFTYDASGQRVRKVWVHGIVDERIYLGGFEIYRKRLTLGGAVDLERETLHVMDDQRRVAMVETKTREGGTALSTPVTRWRFQLDNHLGSATLELDQAGNVISYEEYHPYGSTAFSATSASSEVSAKRYRYTGKERDEETGLYYHGARHYAAWLGRWTAADALGLASPGKPDLNLYAYVNANPINALDPTGNDSIFTAQLARPKSAFEENRDLRFKAAFEKGRAAGAEHGEFLAWTENLTGKLDKKYNGVSVLDRLKPAEKDELAQKILTAYSSLPEAPEYDEKELTREARSGFASGGNQLAFADDAIAIEPGLLDDPLSVVNEARRGHRWTIGPESASAVHDVHAHDPPALFDQARLPTDVMSPLGAELSDALRRIPDVVSRAAISFVRSAARSLDPLRGASGRACRYTGQYQTRKFCDCSHGRRLTRNGRAQNPRAHSVAVAFGGCAQGPE